MKKAIDVEDNLSDIQGNILRPYGHPFARYSFFRFPDDLTGRRCLRSLLDAGITTATTWPSDVTTGRSLKPDTTTNCAITFAGLEALGLPSSLLLLLPFAFRQGMRSRAGLLGDLGQSAPSNWVAGLSDTEMHLMINVHARDEMSCLSHSDYIRGRVQDSGAIEIVDTLQVALLPGKREHFGFRDGISQPSISGTDDNEPGMGVPAADGSWRPIEPGEFLLGYEAESARPPLTGDLHALCDNGSFAVFRKLSQDVQAFREFVSTSATSAFGVNNEATRSRMAASLVGRWTSGAPLLLFPETDPGQIENNFRYSNDPQGLRCPLGAHIRRTNPRDSLFDAHVPFHRILRRGMPYGPEYDSAPQQERGLAFLALNADLEGQFEFIQRQWVNGGEFIGLSDDERDPLVGQNSDGQFTIPSGSISPFVFGLNRFVTTQGGGYFFMPGIEAMRRLADDLF